MTTITNNKLPEWRTALDKCVENYQSTRAWYEENRDSPAALDDMERAEDQLANFVRKCGFSIVLGLLDEIDELQERRNADNQEPAGYHVIKECGKVGCSVATLEEAEKTRDFWNKKWTIRPYFYSAPPAPVVPLSITLPDTSSKAFWSGTGKKEVFHPETYKRWVKEAIERFCMIAGIAVEVKS